MYRIRLRSSSIRLGSTCALSAVAFLLLHSAYALAQSEAEARLNATYPAAAVRSEPGERALFVSPVADPDALPVAVEWDYDDDGAIDETLSYGAPGGGSFTPHREGEQRRIRSEMCLEDRLRAGSR